nr:molybdate ABC transporter substrate-binding protein [Xanthomonas translucens]
MPAGSTRARRAADTRPVGRPAGAPGRIGQRARALMLVARGEAPLGIVYGSDAKAEPKVRVVAVFPADSHAPIVYPVAALRASTHPAATDFVRWLDTPPAQAIFQRHGFSLAH